MDGNPAPVHSSFSSGGFHLSILNKEAPGFVASSDGAGFFPPTASLYIIHNIYMYTYTYMYMYMYKMYMQCYICIYIYTYIHTYIPTYVRTYIHIDINIIYILIKHIHRPLSFQVGLRHGPADLAAQCPAEGPGVAWHLRQRGGDQRGGRAPEEAPQKGPPFGGWDGRKWGN